MTSSWQYHRLPGRRVYRLTGNEGRELLQRISTADLTPLSRESPVATLLTNEKGRVVDVVSVFVDENGSLLLAGMGDDDGRIQRWLERYIIMEDARVADVSTQYTSALAYQVTVDDRWTPPGALRETAAPLRMGANQFSHVLVRSMAGPERETAWATQGGLPADERRFTHDRVAAGVPWMGTELGEHRNPLEARLRPLISFTKGCYIGQEVIARLDSYRKVQAAHTRFEGTVAAGDARPIALQADDGSDAGTITSVAPGEDAVVGLGFVRTGYLSSQMRLRTPLGTEVRPIDTDPAVHIYA